MPIFSTAGFHPTEFMFVEHLWKETFFLSMYHNLILTEKDIQDISDAFHKVADNMNELKEGAENKKPWRNI
jgi:hypothetical protein